MTRSIEDTIFGLLSQLAPSQSLDPNRVAKDIDPEDWRRLLGQVKATCIGLSRKGQIEILRKGKPVPAEGLKGLYRIRAIKNPADEGGA